VHLVGFIIRIYHDARSPERQTWLACIPRVLGVCLCACRQFGPYRLLSCLVQCLLKSYAWERSSMVRTFWNFTCFGSR